MAEEFDYTPLVADCIMTMLSRYSTGVPKDEFYSKNILDVSDVAEDDMSATSPEVIQYCKDNGCYAALPPFEEGVFIDRGQGRYIHWKVLEVEEDYYRLMLDHYPIIFADNDVADFNAGFDIATKAGHTNCWYLAGRIIVKVKILNEDEHIEMISHHPDYVHHAKAMCNDDPAVMTKLLRGLSAKLKSACYVGGVVEDSTYFLPHDLIKIKKKGKYATSDGKFVNGLWVKDAVDTTLELAADYGLHSMLFVSMGPMIEMFTYVNYLLSQKSTSSSTLRKITSVYLPNVEIADVRKERHFGKLKVISDKKPRAINAHNIQRVYTAIAWQRRSHLRHLASGKVVPVKSATCKRHNMEDASAPQVIYKV